MTVKAIAGCVAMFVLAVWLGGCATSDKPKHLADRKWYQGDMDTEDRTFFIDTFFNGR